MRDPGFKKDVPIETRPQDSMFPAGVIESFDRLGIFVDQGDCMATFAESDRQSGAHTAATDNDEFHASPS
jgi:hypothetical protein